MEQLQLFKEDILKRKGKKEQIESDISVLEKTLTKKKKKLIYLEEAQQIVNIVGLKTQQQLQYHISDITSLAMESVFPNPYKVVLEFIEKRNKTECEIYFERNKKKKDPLRSGGHGAANIASFSLRVAGFSLENPKPRNVMILDEPFKDLSPRFHEPASEMTKEVSKQLGLQLIIVSHKPSLSAHANKMFLAKLNKKGITKIKT